jgi:dipeptidyl aminopeptidase/acylaminoacyl peptidase
LIDHRFIPNKIHKPIILFIHGFKGFKDWGAFNMMADYFANAGFVFVKMNFSHNGTTIDQPTDFADLEAFGQNNFSLEQKDITTVLDYISSEINESECDLDNLSVIGHSRGGAAAILAASKDDRVKKLATLAALNDLSSSYSEEVMKEWKETGVYKIIMQEFSKRCHFIIKLLKITSATRRVWM